MRANQTMPRTTRLMEFLRTGLCIGLAGGLAEIVVVSLYAAATGADGALVARQVAAAVGLTGAGAMAGIAVHMALSIGLGLLLAVLMQIAALRTAPAGRVFAVMPLSLGVVWAINFFVVLPVISPGFVHLLPLAVSLASKLAFGLSAAVTWRTLAGSNDGTVLHLTLARLQAAIGSVGHPIVNRLAR